MSVLNKLTNTPGPIEWYTPSWVLEAARGSMGTIDLDPASSEEANRHVKATRFYDKDQDGLSQYWEGNVWLNPPYRRSEIHLWIDRLVNSPNIDQWVCIVNNSTETKWGQQLLSESGIVMFPSRRIKFWRPGGELTEHNTQGQMIVGSPTVNKSMFIEQFKRHGTFFSTIGAFATTVQE
ncbi:MAG: hypothetical protein ISN29_05270 [Gammaproteobacteria bacterium AqS3]|nr:hypothetical protein [Gammaproteobacteria bacterium AqS3]